MMAKPLAQSRNGNKIRRENKDEQAPCKRGTPPDSRHRAAWVRPPGEERVGKGGTYVLIATITEVPVPSHTVAVAAVVESP